MATKTIHLVDIQVHPEANGFPMMRDDELQQLVDDIQRNGLVCPIELYQGKIIDGRNRLKACELAGVEPEFIEIELYDGCTVAEYAWTMNGARRHLTAAQRAAYAAEYLLPVLEAKAKERLKTNENGSRGLPKAKMPEAGQARDEAAKQVGVAARYVSDAKRIKEEAPEVFEQLKSGELTMPKAKRMASPPPPKPKEKEYPATKLFFGILGTVSALRCQLEQQYGYDFEKMLHPDAWDHRRTKDAMDSIIGTKLELDDWLKELEACQR